MKILALSDLHGEMGILEKLAAKIKEIKPDLITFTGDVVKGKARGDEWLKAKEENRFPNANLLEIKNEEKEDLEFYHEFYSFLNQFKIPVATIPGNMDAPKENYFRVALESETTYENLRFVHGKMLMLGRDYLVSGFGGEITENDSEDFFVQIYPRWEAEFNLSDLNYFEQNRILLFHNPPINHVDLDRGQHIGNQAINDLIKVYHPKIVFCGHAHRSQAAEQLADTLVVNPGALKLGNYAVVDAVKREVKFFTL
jgi:Icc-related predicted phosphoesterase